MKKQNISEYHSFRKYRLKTIYNGTNFSSFLDFRLILSITAQSIYVVEASAWTQWKGILIEIIKKTTKKTTTTFKLRSLKMELLKKHILIFFKLGKVVKDYQLLLPLKALDGDFCCLENIDF
jgi:hypothetical protein